MASGSFTLSQLAKAGGMNIDDVRFYRDSGLLPPPRRARSRTDDFGFGTEHVERLKFIRRALACGLTHEDIGALVNPAALVTCGDVYAIAARRLKHLRKAEKADTLAALHLEQASAACARVGSRKDCKLLEALSRPGC